MREIEAEIPYCFLMLAKEHSDERIIFKNYVMAYIAHNFPGYRLARINGMKAIIEKEVTN